MLCCCVGGLHHLFRLHHSGQEWCRCARHQNHQSKGSKGKRDGPSRSLPRLSRWNVGSCTASVIAAPRGNHHLVLSWSRNTSDTFSYRDINMITLFSVWIAASTRINMLAGRVLTGYPIYTQNPQTPTLIQLSHLRCRIDQVP